MACVRARCNVHARRERERERAVIYCAQSMRFAPEGLFAEPVWPPESTARLSDKASKRLCTRQNLRVAVAPHNGVFDALIENNRESFEYIVSNFMFVHNCSVILIDI
jgi:hypothetical protein